MVIWFIPMNIGEYCIKFISDGLFIFVGIEINRSCYKQSKEIVLLKKQTKYMTNFKDFIIHSLFSLIYNFSKPIEHIVILKRGTLLIGYSLILLLKKRFDYIGNLSSLYFNKY